MTIQLKVLLWFFVLSFLFCLGFKRWADKEMEHQQYLQDSIITERHRDKRMIDWKADSLFYELNNSLDSLSVQIDIWKTKANKYDSIMNYEKVRK